MGIFTVCDEFAGGLPGTELLVGSEIALKDIAALQFSRGNSIGKQDNAI
ncbi:MAG: hypothetical protein F2527_03900 [Actinobacteria bacterium]|nr:hypothetical protein [Actinomycetota bacterium]MTA10024.1 hypothetical protein [Actinomycetota bacterium]